MLDALPGDVRAGSDLSRQDHPADLIAALQRLTLPLPTRSYLQDQLTGQGFSAPIARWASTNLRPINGDHRCGALKRFRTVAGRAHLFAASMWGWFCYLVHVCMQGRLSC